MKLEILKCFDEIDMNQHCILACHRVVFVIFTGVILYGTQDEANTGDFLSLNLVNGYLQFRYDLGSGIANITYVPSPCLVYDFFCS